MTHQELCAELYALKPEWGNDSEYVWRLHKPSGATVKVPREQQRADDYRFRNSPETPRFRAENSFCPYYDLEWCLANLPVYQAYQVPSGKGGRLGLKERRNPLTMTVSQHTHWWSIGYNGVLRAGADTPTNAALKLLIELVKAGLLKQQEGK